MRSTDWDIFCRVVDNFGDAGVCWRLARQLASEYDARVRLWIDDLEGLRRLNPAVLDIERQRVDGVEVAKWQGTAHDAAPGDVVIEAFGCGLPDEYLKALSCADQPPLWIVLEYLSAEPWVPEHHLLPSPHPRLAMERYFFFPGFVEGTGGLIREQNLFARRDAFGEPARAAFWRAIGHEPPAADATTVSMFAYDGAPLMDLMQCWERGPDKIVLAIPEGGLQSVAMAYFGTNSLPRSRVLQRGALEVRMTPFMPQSEYDELLWSCDVNFVRGEDSFVRAQWALRPFVWHIYPQADNVHVRKLKAFLELYCEGLPRPAGEAVSDLMHVWNQSAPPAVTPGSAWAACAAQREVLRQHGDAWAKRFSAPGPLTENLVRFCFDKLK